MDRQRNPMRGARARWWFLGTFAALMGAIAAQEATWSVAGATGEGSTSWTTELVEKCALDELHIRLEAEVDTTVLRSIMGSSQRDIHVRRLRGESEVLVPMEIVRVHDMEAGGSSYSIEHGAQVKIKVRAITPGDAETLQEGTRPLPPPAPIECAFDAAFCVPKIVEMNLPEIVDESVTLGVNHTIVLRFADATNRPDASSLDAIERFVVFTAYVGDELRGSWQDDKTLVITVDSLDETKVLPQQELMKALVQTTLRIEERPVDAKDTQLYEIHGDIRLRVAPVGEYVVRILVGDPIESPVFRIASCGDDMSTAVVVLNDELRLNALQKTSAGDPQAALPAPSVFIDGVLSHSGHEAFTLRHSLIQMQDPGSWSLNFWLFTSQEATGSYRTLFFNGDGSGEHRTPSAWLRPDDRRLVMRVSTENEMNVGLDSVGEIPLNEWVNIGLTFRNCSTGVDANATVREECVSAEESTTKPRYYTIRLLINGVVDEEVSIFAPVLPNAGPLHLAKGPWTDGLSGFASQVRVYGAPVSDEVHARLYKQGREDLYRSFSSSSACVMFAKVAGSAVKAPPSAKQISYLAQCLSAKSEDTTALTATTISHEDAAAASELYDQATRLLSTCERSAWDVLVEAAELGYERARRDVGFAMLHGWLPFPESCAANKVDGIRVPMNPNQARRLFLDALKQKDWSVGRLFVLHQRVQEEDSTQHPELKHFQVGLYHLAAAAGRKEAFAILGRLYATGGDTNPVDVNSDISAYHYFHAANDASIAYHSRGKQPLHEMNRLYDGIDKEDELRKGQLGDDDELIQYQKMRADKDNDVDAMANMGDLYYWGARGVPRDHAQAYHYFNRAAEQGHTSAQSAVAGMLLKGEGTKQDNATAIAWYEKAALKNHTRALNGLGFMHFHGSGGMEENKTLALEYFERAAANLEDGDSVFNAGYCHAFGLGTDRNITKAVQYYDSAARKFGHFDAIHELGKIYWGGWDDGSEGKGYVERDSEQAITYLKAASEAGSWGRSVRTGFELFLAGRFQEAAVQYHEASEYGYPVARSNLAYLYDQKLVRPGDLKSERRALQHLQQAWTKNKDDEVLVRIGDFFFYGMGGLRANAVEALHWYSRASAEGVEAGAYNVGHMHEYGLGVPVNYERAERYYMRVLELAPPQAYDKFIAVKLAVLRLQMRKWLDGSPYTHALLSPQSQLSTSMLAEEQEDAGDVRHLLPGREHGDYMSSAYPVMLALLVILLGAWWIRRHQGRVSG